MAETSVPGAVHRRSSGDRPNRTGGSPPPPTSSPVDLISALPDAVIHHIFSFLPLGDVVRTSALSKRWRSTWTAVTDLVFDGGDIEDWAGDRAGTGNTLGFSSIVDSVLSQCSSPMVKRLHVTGFDYHEADDYPEVDRWVEFAEEHRVEDLGLRLIVSLGGFRCIPPQLLYCLSGLVRLEVSACCFSLDGTTRIWWPRLKVLSMEDVDLSDDILGRILMASPVLESLELRRCWGMKNIVIDSTSVKDLLIGGSFYNLEKIRAPHLLSLHVSGTWYDRYPLRGHEDISLDDISSLVEAKLDFAILTVWPGKRTMCCDLLKELLEKLRGVPTITIGGWCFQTVSLLEMEGVPSPLSKCQNLILLGSVDKWDLPGIAYMLRSSHCLEKLVIDLTGFPSCPRLKFELDEESKERFNFDEDDFLCSRKGNFECLGKHLKRVEIINFREDGFGSKPLLALIKFILGDALVLEKLILKAKLPTRCVQKHLQAAVLSKRLGVSKNVLSCPRASKKAEVIFNFPFE